MKPRGDIECNICELILKYAEALLAKNATEVSTYICTYICVCCMCVCSHVHVWFCVMVGGSSHHCV